MADPPGNGTLSYRVLRLEEEQREFKRTVKEELRDFRAEVRREFIELHKESQNQRNEITTLKAGLALARWLGPSLPAIAALVMMWFTR